MFSVKVVWKRTGKPAKGMKVGVAFDGLRGMTRDQCTDEDGNTDFNYDPGPGTIFVSGRTAFKGRIEGRVVVYV